MEEAVTSDKFTLVVRDEGPPNGRKRRKPETVATIEFPGYHQFTLKIDRAEGQGKRYTQIIQRYPIRTQNRTKKSHIIHFYPLSPVYTVTARLRLNYKLYSEIIQNIFETNMYLPAFKLQHFFHYLDVIENFENI